MIRLHLHREAGALIGIDSPPPPPPPPPLAWVVDGVEDEDAGTPEVTGSKRDKEMTNHFGFPTYSFLRGNGKLFFTSFSFFLLFLNLHYILAGSIQGKN